MAIGVWFHNRQKKVIFLYILYFSSVVKPYDLHLNLNGLSRIGNV